MLLIKRAKPAVVPVAIDGAFEAWPKGRALPRARGTIRVMFGQPIPAEGLIAMSGHAAIGHLREKIMEMARRLQIKKSCALR